ncbi:MAG: hypothetical protein ACRET7_08445 [Burkholderiales bacterium]
MIRNDHELAVIRERVAKLETLLETLRKTARPEEWRPTGRESLGGYRALLLPCLAQERRKAG